MRRLALSNPDDQIALILNKQGRKTGKGNRFTSHRVNSLRHAHNIPCFEPGVSPGGEIADGVTTFNLNQARRKLGVSIATVLRWLKEGWLQGRQATQFARWVIPITDKDVERLRSIQTDLGGILPSLDLDAAAQALRVSRESLLNKIRTGEITAQRIQEGRRSRWTVRNTRYRGPAARIVRLDPLWLSSLFLMLRSGRQPSPFSLTYRNVSAPVETGEVLRAEMPCAEGLATHGGSESCVNNREVRGEALTGVCAGLVLSRERRSSGCRRS